MSPSWFTTSVVPYSVAQIDSRFKDRRTDGPEDRQTDGPTTFKDNRSPSFDTNRKIFAV